MNSVLTLLHIEVGTASTALTFGLLLALGILGGRIARRFGLPSITGYLIFGILLNPFFTQKIDPSGLYLDPATIKILSEFISIIALSLIAFLIGGSLRIDSLKGMGKSISMITLIQGLLPFIFVFLLLAFAGPHLIPGALSDRNAYLALGLVAGAIAVATAPAATVAVLHEIKARGPMTTSILGIVALDDAMSVVIFIMMVGIASALLYSGITLIEILLVPIIHVLLSILLGVLFGYLLVFISRFFRGQRSSLTLVVLGVVVICGGVAEMLGFEYILTCMSTGFVVINQMKHPRLIDLAISIEDLVFVAFFAVVGAHLDFSKLGEATIVGSLLLLARFAGKYMGSWLGATVTKAPSYMRKLLGIALLPQAGVALGLAMAVENKPGLAQIAALLQSIVFVVVIITEIIAPPLVKWAVMRSGEGRAPRPS